MGNATAAFTDLGDLMRVPPPKVGEFEDDAPALFYESACEADLVPAAKSGDHHAFAELHRRYRLLLVRKIRRIVRNREDAEDVLQDTMISAFRHLASFRAESSFRTWITSIATNNSLMLLRKRKGHPEIGLTHVTTDGNAFEIPEVADPLPNPEELYARWQRNHRVAHAVKKLPSSFRQVVDRFYQDELRIVDTANAMGITVSAAKSRLSRARNVLRRELKNDDAQNSDR
jgi:RNA polymerase sigma-70 factor (ECF subfamily)